MGSASLTHPTLAATRVGDMFMSCKSVTVREFQLGPSAVKRPSLGRDIIGELVVSDIEDSKIHEPFIEILLE
jgi:hypothetical protein